MTCVHENYYRKKKKKKLSSYGTSYLTCEGERLRHSPKNWFATSNKMIVAKQSHNKPAQIFKRNIDMAYH